MQSGERGGRVCTKIDEGLGIVTIN